MVIFLRKRDRDRERKSEREKGVINQLIQLWGKEESMKRNHIDHGIMKIK